MVIYCPGWEMLEIRFLAQSKDRNRI